MTIASEIATVVCSHCERDILAPNIDLHYAHCSRNLERCTICREMVPKKHAEEHYLETHAPVACSLCSQTIERELLDVHKGETCPQRTVTCEYCEFPLPAVDLCKHQELCGSRTDYCDLCNKYIRRRERIEHDIQLHSSVDGVAEPSRDERRTEGERGDHHRRQPRNMLQKRLWFSIAITGIVVLIGSIFLQKRADSHQQQ